MQKCFPPRNGIRSRSRPAVADWLSAVDQGPRAVRRDALARSKISPLGPDLIAPISCAPQSRRTSKELKARWLGRKEPHSLAPSLLPSLDPSPLGLSAPRSYGTTASRCRNTPCNTHQILHCCHVSSPPNSELSHRKDLSSMHDGSYSPPAEHVPSSWADRYFVDSRLSLLGFMRAYIN